MPAIGYLLPTREQVMSASGPDFPQIFALAEQAEAAGFDSVWVGDSVLARPRLEALTTLAAVAARTRRVRLGTAILLPALRQPVVLANEIANVDLIAGGRLVLGLGIASKGDAITREFQACGVPHIQRIGRFEETIEIVRRLWSEPQVTFKGRYFELDKVTLGLKSSQRGGPRLWLAGHTENPLRRVAKLGDGWLPNPASPEIFTTAMARLDALCKEAGRDPTTIHRAVYTTINVNADATQAEQELRAFTEGYYSSPYDVQKNRQSLCAGNAKTCIAWLRSYAAAGAQTIVVRLGGPNQPRHLERFTKEVLPAVMAP